MTNSEDLHIITRVKTLNLILILLATISAGAQSTTPGQPVTATVDASKTGPPISPYVYGQFLEHIGNLIYSSLWSEMLDDRKFYYAVAPAPAGDANAQGGFGGAGRRRGVAPGRWNPIGPANSVIMDTTNPFVGDHTPLITLAGSEPRGIRQTDVNFVKGANYNGRVELAGDSSAKASIDIVWGANAGVLRQTIPLGKLGKRYKKFSFSFKADQSGPAQFDITGTGHGSFHIGAVSLMPADNLDGWKPNAIAILKSLDSGIYRIPGGNFVSAFEWRNSIGNPDRRPPVFDPVWHALQPNDIGTDEFMTLCKLLGVEPYITVNAGLGDEWSAAQLVEYCNGSISTSMGKLRAANGHPKPHDVKFWGIGNEMWGITYQYGAMSLDQFEFKNNDFANAMRKVDPTITLIASGAMPDTMTGSRQSLRLGIDNLMDHYLNATGSGVTTTDTWSSVLGTRFQSFVRDNLVPRYLSPEDWTGGLLQHCFNDFDMISEHFYNYGGTHFSLAQARQVPNDPNEPVTDWMRRPANHIRIKYEEYKAYEKLIPELAVHPRPLSIDEWAYGGWGGGSKYPVYPSYAWVFHEMFRHSDIFQMACQTFATSLLVRHGTEVSLTPNGLVFKIYSEHFGTIPIEISGNSPQPKPIDPPGGEQPEVNAGSPTFPLDVVAAWTKDRHALTVAVLNPTDVEQPLKLKITGANLSGKGTLWRLASNGNNGQNPVITSSPVDAIPDSLSLPAFSVSIYDLSTK